MDTNFHFLTNALFAVICATMGTSFLSLHTPNKEGLKSYRISLKVLASAYFAMSLLIVAVLTFNLADNSREYFTFLSIFISSTQALLFGFTLITLINPHFVRIQNLLHHTLPYLFFALLYFVSYSSFGDPNLSSIGDLKEYINHPTIWIRVLFLGYYLFQLGYYTYLFLREAKLYDQELLNYFSEVMQLKMKWVHVAFFSSLAVGTLAMVSNFFPGHYDWMVTLAYAFFYFGFAQEYIQYNKLFTIIEPAIVATTTETTPILIRTLIKTDWTTYRQIISTRKYYRESGVNIEELAGKLNIGRTTLSNLINREEGVNFNTWINRLRIEDAKQLLIENPEFTISTISEMVGYTEQANFSRQFKQIAGESPLVWRKKLAAS